ncbi:unnamed protein product [Rotaria sp. Silwood1]|nr:unnamed protein product [Rotaria sp. Silwood1]CAF1628980.1 unnamed protein product [Rotaria sp. Silwood1]CAF3726494.1 unnamed protein product [Rotaria sp. Silwood1]CAF3752314.1 unnamed protein product [Rotaria sp. Silwood1]CAF4757890.1 unnamed protein product [Rotaria sp. Silwood1]
MSNSKFPSTDSSSLHSIQSQYQLSPDLIIKIDDIINNHNYQLFFDRHLSYDQLMFILNHPNCMEREVLDFIINQLEHLISDENIRQVYLNNLYIFAGCFKLVDRYTYIRGNRIYLDDDDDDDNDNQTLPDDDTSDSASLLTDRMEDIENVVMDDSDLENFLEAFHDCTSSESEEDN